jgi:hypothetical protein
VLDSRTHQGKFGEDYIRVLASAAGLIVRTDDVDRDGVDLGIKFPGRVGAAASPAIDVQVKSWSRPRRTPSGDEWHFDGLNEAQFNRLAGEDFTVPRYLFLVVVPPESKRYVNMWTDGMLLQHLAYFQSFQSELPVERPETSRRRPVRVPVSNLLTVRSLLSLVHPGLPYGGRMV